METGANGNENPTGKRSVEPSLSKLETGGNCLCHCIGDGLTWLKDKKKSNARFLRAERHDCMQPIAPEFTSWWAGRNTKEPARHTPELHRLP